MELVFTVQSVSIHEDVHGKQVMYHLSHGQEFDLESVETAAEAMKDGPSGSISLSIRGTKTPTLSIGSTAKLTFNEE